MLELDCAAIENGARSTCTPRLHAREKRSENCFGKVRVPLEERSMRDDATGERELLLVLYHFLAGLPAALAVPLVSLDFLVTSLMTPTATVWRMSRTAKRPSGG